ncbi:MAG: sigma-70 family RNA polymerase sigma factor [Gracilimonas sp.]|nr:sigma-70 family RNA polymerase sigma factor [Gracilimonas sp.]
MANKDDNKLIELSLLGDHHAFGILVKKYEKPMYRTAWGIVKNSDTAKDITQSAFIKCWNNLDSYNSNYRFYSWLYRIIVNEALNYVRDKKQHSPLSIHHSDGNNPYLQLLQKEEHLALAEALGELSADHRIVIQLRHFEEMSYRDIAHILEIPPKTVKSRLYSARILLKDLLA